MNWFILFVCNRKYWLLFLYDVIFDQHSSATVIKNEEGEGQNVMFAGRRKSVNKFKENQGYASF